MNHTRIAPAIVMLAALGIAYGDNRYVQHNLVSDIAGQADYTDPHLVNPWGIAISPTSPFWIVNNRTGRATVYDSNGKPSVLVVPVQGNLGTEGSSPTGQVFNGTGAFALPEGRSAIFLFCTEDGVISGWYPGIPGNTSGIAVNNTSNAVYKGMAIGVSDAGPVLYVTNFLTGTVDVFGGDFSPITLDGSFTDPDLPGGFAPFNVYVAGDKVYVSYAKPDDEKEDDVPGEGNGVVNVFDVNGHFLQRLVTGDRLNSPWGMTIAPAEFGDFGNALLVGNFGDGRIHAFDPSTGALLGVLSDANGDAIVNPGLWGLQFGNGVSGGDTAGLYFTAGISGPDGDAIESHGLFGVIQAAPAIRPQGVVNTAGFQKSIAPDTWITIYGKNLAPITRLWQASDIVEGRLPTSLAGVSVTVDGKAAYVKYVSPNQVEALVPGNIGLGDINVETTNAGLTGAASIVKAQTVSPGLFHTEKYAIATHADGTLVGPSTFLPGASKPASPGETITLYGTGFGPADPAAIEGMEVTSPLALASPAAITIGGSSAENVFQGLVAAGLYEFRVKVPVGPPPGDLPVMVQTGGVLSPTGVFIAVDAGPTEMTPPPVYEAQIDKFTFAPDPVNVTAGATLTWTNQENVPHTVVGDNDEFHSQVLNRSGKFSVTFDKPGTYSYHCSIHPFMKGQVVVK